MQLGRVFRKLSIVIAFILLYYVYYLLKGWIRWIPSNPQEVLTYSLLAMVPGLVFALATISEGIIKRSLVLPWVICWLGSTVMFPGLVTILLIFTTRYLPCSSQLSFCGAMIRFLVTACVGLVLHSIFILFVGFRRQSRILLAFIQGLTFGVVAWILAETFLISDRLDATWVLDEAVLSIITTFISGAAIFLAFFLSSGLLTLSTSIRDEDPVRQVK